MGGNLTQSTLELLSPCHSLEYTHMTDLPLTKTDYAKDFLPGLLLQGQQQLMHSPSPGKEKTIG